MRRGLILLSTLIVGAPASAHAGRSFYGWMQGSEVMPERGAELQTWLAEENRIDDEALRSESEWGAGAFIGITDQLEIGFPVNIVWGQTPGMPGNTALHDYGVQLRYRMVTQDPEDAPPFAPLVRIGIDRLVLDRTTMRPHVTIVGAYEAGIVHAQAEVGFVAELARDDNDPMTKESNFDVRPGIGASIRAVGDLRFGAELFAQVALSTGTSWAVIGPDISWTHGRTWVSATYGIGITGIKDAPRLQWGIAF